MRLNDVTRDIIKHEVASIIGTESVVRLFGSRLDDNQRGGDIDLLIECPEPIENRVLVECKIAARLYIRLGGRKVDVLIKGSQTPIRPIHRQAMQYGVVL